MSKELAKFEATYKKHAAAIKAHTAASGARMKKELTLSIGDASSSGEAHIGESMANARDAGVTGTKLADFMKFKGFKDAVAAYTIAINVCEKYQKALKTFCDEAKSTSDELGKLHAAIEKDLKGRKDKSQSKSDIEKLRDTVAADIKELNKAAAVYASVPPGQITYVEKYEKTIDKILKEAPDVQAQARDSTELPQMLVDRNRKKSLNQGMALLKQIGEACDAALVAAQTDLKAAQPELKKAAGLLADLRKVHEAFKKAFDHATKSRSLAGTKDEAAVKKVMETLDKALVASERKLKGMATTIKKAAA